jgi:uncharacterized cysteine cluster protein YcgN (CxxCxxCC family)
MSKYKQFAKVRSTKHEDGKCNRCGRCCRNKLELPDGTVVLEEGYCKYYSEKDKGCTIFDRRHEHDVACLTMKQAICQKVMPEDCPYTKNIRKYKTIVEDWKTKK